ncbi:MAG: hypothetical protein U0T36_08215 [Saprospiraceae bacterium]
MSHQMVGWKIPKSILCLSVYVWVAPLLLDDGSIETRYGDVTLV